MSKLAKNSIATGLATLLVTTGMAFAANGATTTTSYAEAQFIAAQNGLGEIVNPLGDALEEGGANACEPATADCAAEEFTQSPLQPLENLTVPIGDAAAGSELGAAGNYAKAGGGASNAASGAVTEDGIVQVGGGNGSAEADAKLDLAKGALGELGATNALANLSLTLGAISSTIELDSPTADPVRDYNIAGGDITLSVPALKEVATAVDGVREVDLSDVDLNVSTLCTALGGSLNVALDGLGLLPAVVTALELAGLVTDGKIDLCSNAVATALGGAGVIEAKITGLNAITEGLTSVTQDGVTFDFAKGEIRIDIEAALLALGKDINNLPPNTDLLNEILPALVLNIDDLIQNISDNLVQDLSDNFDVQVSVGGTPVPIAPLTAGVRDQLLPGLQTALDGVADGFTNLGDPLAGALDEITKGLSAVIQLIVNVPDVYTPLQSGGASALAVSEQYSQTALEILLLGGEGADILLANTLVGPNASFDSDDDGDQAAAGDNDDDGDNANAADGDDDGSTTGAIADADSAADADASTTLPDAGAGNLLPFFLLGLALLAFGLGVLLNERRRLGGIDAGLTA